MANSGTVTAGSAALASQYNNLRDDVLNVSTGHTHTGASENGAKVAATGVSSGTAANGAVLTADGSGAAAFLAAAASGGILKYEEFTSSGSFVIPASASSSAIAVVEVISGGCGGISGEVAGSGTTTQGGNGGGGGSYGLWTHLASTFGTAGGTVTVTIGAGGAGGTGTTATSGVAGSFPGATSFGSLKLNYLSGSKTRSGAPACLGILNSVSKQSGGTAAGTVTTGSTTVTNWGEPLIYGGHGGVQGGGAPGEAFSAFDNDLGGGGGGAGGGHNTSNTTFAGAKGGKRYGVYGEHHTSVVGDAKLTFGNGPAGGTAGGVGGGAGGTPTVGSGDGGGGGGAALTGNGGAGAAGAQPGGGGGGGGAARTGGTSGAGGAGGNGRVRVWVIG